MSSYAETRASTRVPSVTMTVRPEQARFDLQVDVQVDSAVSAVTRFQGAAQRLVAALPALGASLELHGVDLPHEPGKLSSATSRLHATLVLPLPPTASFWERARRVAEADDLLRAFVTEGRKQQPALEMRRHLPAFVVADPEQRRAALVERLHARARSLGAGAVQLSGLRFDQPVTQESQGAERVELALAVEGTAALTLG